MRNILRIFTNDLRSIARHFFALVIAIAVCVIPALYAWFNIFSNWDPYGGTGNIPIALVSRDAGCMLDSGEWKNEGSEIVAEMAASTSIHWIPTNYSEAMEGVRSGKYYGALVLGEHLSRNMHNITEALYDNSPSITFYQNAKTNAIANKITETAASTAEHNIQLRYLSILIENLFARIDETLDGFDGEKKVDDLIRALDRLQGNLLSYSSMLEAMEQTNIGMSSSLAKAGDNISGISFSGQLEGLDAAKASINTAKIRTLEFVWKAQQKAEETQEWLRGQTTLSEDVLNQLISRNNELIAYLGEMEKSFPLDDRSVITVSVRSAIRQIVDRLEEMNQICQDTITGIRNGTLGVKELTEIKNSLLNMLGTVRNYLHDKLEKSVEQLFDSLIEDLDLVRTILASVDTTLAAVPPVMYSGDRTLRALNVTLGQVGELLRNLAGTVGDLKARLEELRDNDALESLIEILHGDPEEFAAFLSSPVEVETRTIYPVNSYGAAMTPFYSTLALWVGCVVLSAVIKAEAGKKGLRHPTDTQLYFGRFLTFFFFGQIQSLIIVWGDLHLLGVECLHPGWFYFAGAVTSFVFVCLIYSLVLVIGDVGKAVVVVIMIVQIAGSSGSYPIEILPEIFSKIYLFFPYPYAINAMREAICGMYRFDYWKYLGQLLIFGGIGLLIGLVLRRPFHGIHVFVEEEMHESGVL